MCSVSTSVLYDKDSSTILHETITRSCLVKTDRKSQEFDQCHWNEAVRSSWYDSGFNNEDTGKSGEQVEKINGEWGPVPLELTCSRTCVPDSEGTCNKPIPNGLFDEELESGIFCAQTSGEDLVVHSIFDDSIVQCPKFDANGTEIKYCYTKVEYSLVYFCVLSPFRW